MPNPVPVRRIRREPEQATREILDAAEEILGERPYRELSVDLLMRRTGMTRSSFYHYFRSIEEVAVGLLQRVQAEMLEAVGPWLAAAGDQEPHARIQSAILAVARVFARHGPVMAAINEASFHHQTVERVWRQGILGEWITAVSTQIREERERGVTRVQDPEEVVRALLLMNTAVFVERLGRPGEDSPEAVAATLSYIWIGALYPEALVEER